MSKIMKENVLGAGLHHGNLAGAGHHVHVVVAQQVEETVETEFTAGNLDGEHLARGVNHLGAEHVAKLQNFGLVLAEAHANEHNLAVEGGFVAEIDDFYHIHQFAELLDNLIQLFIVFLHVDGHAGELGVLAGSHVEGMNVVAATGEQTCYAGKHTKLVFHEHGDGINRFVSRHNE